MVLPDEVSAEEVLGSLAVKGNWIARAAITDVRVHDPDVTCTGPLDWVPKTCELKKLCAEETCNQDSCHGLRT